MKNKLILSLGPIVLGVSSSFIYDWIKHLPISTGIISFSQWLWKVVFFTEVKLWHVLFVFILGILIFFIARKIKKNEPNQDFLKYTKDQFNGFTWTWRWIHNKSIGEWNTNNIKPQCPKCATSMNYYFGVLNCYQANCPRCEYIIGRIKSKEDIDALIIDNLDKGHFLIKENGIKEN